MHINDVRNVKEYARIVGDIQREDREKIKDSRKSGFFWSDYQFDEENHRVVNNIRRQKNYTVANLYTMLAACFSVFGSTTAPSMTSYIFNPNQCQFVSVNGTVISASHPTTSGIAIMAGTGFVQAPTAILVRAGTDTTTVSTPTTADIVSPASPTSNSNTLSLVTNHTTASIQWVVNWSAMSFGTSGTTNIGEFGLSSQITDSVNGTQYLLWNRLAVADQNVGFTSPISVNNLASYGVTITLVI